MPLSVPFCNTDRLAELPPPALTHTPALLPGPSAPATAAQLLSVTASSNGRILECADLETRNMLQQSISQFVAWEPSELVMICSIHT